jgi:molybdopterin converting factor small subunit
MAQVRVRLMGTFREASGEAEIVLTLSDGADVSSAIDALRDRFGEPFGNVLMDPVMGSPLPNGLILRNGVEIGNLRGLDTALIDGDTLVLISVTHGG